MAHGKARLRRMRPKPIEQRFALGEIEAENIGVRTPAKEECFVAGARVGADQRMMCADGLANVDDLLIAFTQMACAVARSVMHRNLSLRRLLQFSGQGLIPLPELIESASLR